MPSITSWSRIEPAPPGNDTSAGVAARTSDALWLLARQWQVGEFQASDAGSPVVARWRGHAAPPTRYHLGPLAAETQTTAARFEGGGVPLEVFVERQPFGLAAADAPGAEGLRLGVESGEHFLRILASQFGGQATATDYGPAFRRTFAVLPLPDDVIERLDASSRGYLRVVAGRALDGRRLRAGIERLGRNRLPDIGSPIAPGDAAEIRAALSSWMEWLDGLFSRPAAEEGSTWQRDRMEYAFSLATRTSADPFDEWTLTSDQYGGGVLDWYSFDRNGDVNVGTTPAEADEGEELVQTSLPAPVTLRGMPAARFWEMEDALLDLGALQPGATDLAALLLIDTISGYGNDWFVVGIDLPTGSLVTTRSLVVVDTFGVETALLPNGAPGTSFSSRDWSMFQQGMPFGEGSVALSNAFLLAGTLAQPLEGPAIEEVLLLRDEQANLAWAVERLLTGPLEQAVDAAADATAVPVGDATPGAPAGRGDLPRYRLASEVPAHWIPLLPVRPDPQSAEVRLARAALLDVGGRRTVRSVASLLGDPDEALLIPEEEVPREGAVVRRSFQAARDSEGRLHVWLTHRKSVGRGEGSSGLRFDTLDPR